MQEELHNKLADLKEYIKELDSVAIAFSSGLDVRVLLGVFQALLDNGATVVVIEHDLDVIRNADFLIDMGPGGGEAGGRIVASGTPEEIQLNPDSITGQYL